jgi:hypothetical protein
MAQHVDVVSVGSLPSNELFDMNYAISQGTSRAAGDRPGDAWLHRPRLRLSMTLTPG